MQSKSKQMPESIQQYIDSKIQAELKVFEQHLTSYIDSVISKKIAEQCDRTLSKCDSMLDSKIDSKVEAQLSSKTSKLGKRIDDLTSQQKTLSSSLSGQIVAATGDVRKQVNTVIAKEIMPKIQNQLDLVRNHMVDGHELTVAYQKRVYESGDREVFGSSRAIEHKSNPNSAMSKVAFQRSVFALTDEDDDY